MTKQTLASDCCKTSGRCLKTVTGNRAISLPPGDIKVQRGKVMPQGHTACMWQSQDLDPASQLQAKNLPGRHYPLSQGDPSAWASVAQFRVSGEVH